MKRVKARPAQVHWRNSGRAMQPSSRDTPPHRKMISSSTGGGSCSAYQSRVPLCRRRRYQLSGVCLSPALPTLLLSGSLVSSAPSLSPNRSCSRSRARSRSFPRSFSAERAQRGGRTDKSVLSVENGLVLTLAMNHLSPCRSFFFFLAQSRPPSFLSQELDPSARGASADPEID